MLKNIAHRPYPLPTGRWIMRQRWNDLLFMHWPIAPEALRSLIPASLELDTFDGQAWIAVVPFWMDRVRNRLVGEGTFGIPTTGQFDELNLRTYVRSPRSGKAGVYFFSLDCSSLLAVVGARTLFHLPYFLAAMGRETVPEGESAAGWKKANGGLGEAAFAARVNACPSGTKSNSPWIEYRSRRMLAGSAEFEARYRPTGPLPQSQPGTLQHFLTERYCLFTTFAGRTLVGDIHHDLWPLEAAEAEILVNTLPAAHGVVLPDAPPLLHFAKELEVTIWPLRRDLSV